MYAELQIDKQQYDFSLWGMQFKGPTCAPIHLLCTPSLLLAQTIQFICTNLRLSIQMLLCAVILSKNCAYVWALKPLCLQADIDGVSYKASNTVTFNFAPLYYYYLVIYYCYHYFCPQYHFSKYITVLRSLFTWHLIFFCFALTFCNRKLYTITLATVTIITIFYYYYYSSIPAITITYYYHPMSAFKDKSPFHNCCCKLFFGTLTKL